MGSSLTAAVARPPTLPEVRQVDLAVRPLR